MFGNLNKETKWTQYEGIETPTASILIDNKKDTIAVNVKNPYVTPEMFGAVGDGVADDTKAIQYAIDTNKVVVLSNTYLCSTVVISKDTEILGCNNAKILPKYTDNEFYDTIFSFTNCKLSIKKLSFIGKTLDKFTTGDLVLNPIIYGNNGELILDGCTFNNIHFTNIKPASTTFIDRYASLIKTFDTNIVLNNSRVTNCWGELTQTLSKKATKEDIKTTFNCKNLYVNNNTGSFNIVAKEIVLENIIGNHTSYEGSLFNAFGVEETSFINCNVNGSTTVFDSTEDGLFLCRHIVIQNCKSSIIAYAEKIDASNSLFTYNLHNSQLPEFSPYTAKNYPESITINAVDCEVVRGQGSEKVTSTLIFNFTRCKLNDVIYTIGGGNVNKTYVTCNQMTIKGGQFYRGENSFYNCVIDKTPILQSGSYAPQIFGDCNSSVGVTGGKITFTGCYCNENITLVGNNSWYRFLATENLSAT